MNACPKFRVLFIGTLATAIVAVLAGTGWVLFPRYMAYRERAAIEPRIREIRLVAKRKDIDELFGPHALWDSTTDAGGHNIRVLLRPKRHQWYCVVETWEPSSTEPWARNEPVSVKVYRLEPPPHGYRLQTAWGRETMETYSRAYGEVERHPVYHDPYVLDFLAAVTGGAARHLGIEYELIHEDAAQQSPVPIEQGGATPPPR